MKYVLVDCCPVPAKLAPVIREVKRVSGQTLISCYRADDARALLEQCGKKSQAQLYYGWVHRLPGYNPANPPGRSTHELRSDARAYRLPAGTRLAYWMVGQDWTNAGGVVKAYARLGYTASVTYPGDPREYHHVNLRKKPIFSIWKIRPLKRGMRGPRAYIVIKMLKVIKSHYTGRTYLPKSFENKRHYGVTVASAIKDFQRDHHQKPDGIVGIQTRRQLGDSYRYWKNRK